MASQELMSINTVAARLGLSVHQLRRWELMFGLEIKRGRGQQRQYRSEDLTVLERIKELVEQGWPTSQIRPQIEAEGLITPKIIGVPQQPGNPEVILESIIGFRNFAERRFIEISKQIDELRQLVISMTLKQELAGETDSPWQAVEPAKEMQTVAEIKQRPPEEISIGPQVNVMLEQSIHPVVPNYQEASTIAADTEDTNDMAIEVTSQSESPVPPPPPSIREVVEPANLGLGEVTDQNYLTVLGRALDLIGWTDEEADDYSDKTFGISHWDELGRSQAELLVAHLVNLIKEKRENGEEELDALPEPVLSAGESPSNDEISSEINLSAPDSNTDSGSPAQSISDLADIEPEVSAPEELSSVAPESELMKQSFETQPQPMQPTPPPPPPPPPPAPSSTPGQPSGYAYSASVDAGSSNRVIPPPPPLKEPIPVEVRPAGRYDAVYSLGQDVPDTASHPSQEQLSTANDNQAADLLSSPQVGSSGEVVPPSAPQPPVPSAAQPPSPTAAQPPSPSAAQPPPAPPYSSIRPALPDAGKGAQGYQAPPPYNMQQAASPGPAGIYPVQRAPHDDETEKPSTQTSNSSAESGSANEDEH